MRRALRAAVTTTVLALALSPLRVLPALAEPAQPAPRPTTPAGYVPGQSVEDTGRRTQTSKTFRNPDGTFTTRFATGSVHAKENGRWVDVDTDLETRGDGRHHAKKLRFGLRLADGNTGELTTLDLDGSEIGFTLVGARKGDKPKLHRNTIRYANVFPDVDVEVRVHGDGFKENFVLSRPGARSDFTYAVRSPADVTLTKRADGGIDIARDGRALGEIPPPFMAESEDGEPLGPRSRDVSYTLSGEPGSYRIDIRADRAWLDAPERDYPIVIDPTFYASGGANNDETTCSAAGLENTYYTDLGAGYESETPLGWCKGWLRFNLTSLANTTVTTADLELTHWHSYDNRTSTMYVDRLDPVDWPYPVAENDMTYRGGAYRPYRSYDADTVGESRFVGRYTFQINGWGQANKGKWAGLMIESGANGYYSAPLPSGTATTNEHLYKLFRSAEYGVATDRPEAVVTWSNATPAVPATTTLSPADEYLSTVKPYSFGAGFSDTDGGTGHAVFEVWNSAMTTRLYVGTGSTVSSGGTSYWYPSGTWPDGRYRWRAAAHDTRAQSGWTAWRDFVVDDGAPGQPTSPRWQAGTATSSTTITAQWTPGADALSGVTNHYLRVSTRTDDPATTTDEFASGLVWGGYTGSGTGSYTLTSSNGITAGRTYYFKVASRDAAGNLGTYSAISPGIVVDQTAPGAPLSVTSTSHPANTSSNDPTVDVVWTPPTAPTPGTESDIAGYEVAFDPNATAPATAPRTTYGAAARTATSAPLPDGTWYAHVRAVDAAGNRGPDRTHGPMTIDSVQPGAPSVSCPTHPSGAWRASRDLVCDIVGGSADTTGYSVVLDQSADTVPPQTVNHVGPVYTAQAPSDGRHWLHVRGVDAAGNWSTTSAPYDVRVDSTKPAPPAVTSPTHEVEGKWHRHDAPVFEWTASDTAPIVGYAYVLDQEETTEAPYTVTTTEKRHDSPPRADGVWYFHVRALNAAGLWSDTAHRAARVDVTPPRAAVATSASHPDGDPVSITRVDMSWTAQPGHDDMSRVAGYSYAFTADATTEIDASVDTEDTKVSQTLTDGTWYFHLRTVDHAGNSSETVYGPIRIDANGPPVSTTEKNRFLGLWLPRAESEDFYQDYFAHDGYPQYILDEGFHGLPDAAKRYLGAQLWAAFVAGKESDPAMDEAGRQVMYEFVFDKQKQADPEDPSRFEEEPEPFTPGPDASKPRPADVAKVLAESSGTYESVRAAVDALPVVGTQDLPVSLEDLPETVTELVDSALSGDALAEVARLAAAGDPVGEVLARLAKVDAALGVELDTRAVFALPDRLPVNYTACWDTASSDDCTDATAVGAPVHVDLSGDGTYDATVTFGPAADTAVTALAHLQLDVRRFVPLGIPVPGVPETQPSDLAGAPLRAHIWVVYDLGLAPAPSPGRLQFGFDGYVRGDRLAERTTLKFAPDDLLSAAQRDFSGSFWLTHEWPGDERPKWALTVGRRALEGDPDPLDAVVTFTRAQDVSGYVSLRNDDGVTWPIDRTTRLRFDTAVTSPVYADVAETISSANETSKARIELSSIPAGSDFTAVRTREANAGEAPGADTTKFEVDNALDPAAKLPRVAGLATIVNDRGQDHATFDLRRIPADTVVTGVRTAASAFDYTYDSSGESGPIAASLRTKDVDGVLTLAMQATASALPDFVNATYGPSGTDDRTMFTVRSSARAKDLSFTGYDRRLRLTMDADLVDLPQYVNGEVSPGGRYFHVTAGYPGEAGVGFADGVMSANGGRVSRRSGEHATLVRAGDAIGASFRLHGLRSGTVELAEKKVAGDFTVDPGSYDTTHPVDVAADLDGIHGTIRLSNLPASAKFGVDLGSPAAVYADASDAIGRAVFYGRHPNGVIVDGAVANIPADMTLGAVLSGSAIAAAYQAATAGADVERMMFSTDANPGDASGVTVRAAATDLPAKMTAAADVDRRVAAYRGLTANDQPAGIGRVDLRVSVNGARPRVPAGQHVTLDGTRTRWGASARMDDVVAVDADVNAELTAGHALLQLARRGAPVTVDLALDDLRGYAYVSDVPTRVEVWADVAAKRFRYEANASVQSVVGYGAKVGTGPTILGRIDGAPLTAELTATPVGSAWQLVAETSAPVRRAAVAYSPDYLARGVTTSDNFVVADAAATPAGDGTYTKMPASFTAVADLGARSVRWRGDGPIGDVVVYGRGEILHDWTVYAEAQDVPAEFDAAFGRNVKLFDGRGGSVGHLRMHASNRGRPLIHGGAGSHITGRFDLGDDTVDVSADVSGVSHAQFVTRDRYAGIAGSATNGGRPIRADVEVDDLYPAYSNDRGGDEFTVQIKGTVNRIPASVGVTAQAGSLEYEASGHLGGQLQVWAGWRKALLSAFTPTAVDDGIGVTDGACTAAQGCDPTEPDNSGRFMCGDDECYAARALVTHDALPTRLTARLRDDLTEPLVEADGIAAGTLAVHADLRHLLSERIVVDMRQEGVKEGAWLKLGPIRMTRDTEGALVEGDFGISPQAGRLWGTVEMPDTTFGFGPGNPSYEIRRPKAEIEIAELPLAVHVEARWGKVSRAEVATTDPITLVEPSFSAELWQRNPEGELEKVANDTNTACFDRARFCGTVSLSDLPAAPTDNPITLQMETKRHAVGADQVFEAPTITYTAPQSGVDLVVNVDPGLLVLGSGKADLYFDTVSGKAAARVGKVTAKAGNLSTRFEVRASEDRREATVTSTGPTGFLYVEADKFAVDAGGRFEEGFPVGGGLLVGWRAALGGKVHITGDYSHVTISNVTNATLLMDEFHLGFGLTGTYGYFELGVNRFRFQVEDVTVSLGLRLGNRLPWNKDFFSPSIPIYPFAQTFNNFTPIVMDAREYGDVPFVGQLGGIGIPGVKLQLRPWPGVEPYAEQGVVEIQHDGKDKLFTLLPAVDNSLLVKMWALAVCLMYNPFDNTDLRVRFDLNPF